MSEIKVKQTVDDSQAVAAWQRMLTLMDRIEGKLSRQGKAGQKAGQQTQGGFQGALRTLGQFGSAITGVGTLVQGVQKLGQMLLQEYQEVKQARGEAANVQKEVAPARKAALLNTGVENADELDAAVERAASHGAKRADVYTAASGAASFRGELGLDTAFEAVDVAAQIDPSSGEAMQTVAEGILTLQKVVQDADSWDIAAFENRVKQQAAVSTSQDFSANIATGMADLVRMGNSAEESGALLAYLTQGSGDTTGKTSRTGAIQLARQLQQNVPFEEGLFNQLEAIGNSEQLRRRLLGSMMSGQNYDSETRRAILEGKQETSKGELTGEAKMMATFAKLINDASARQVLRENRDQLGTVQGGGAEFRQMLGEINSSGANATFEALRRAESVLESQRSSDVKAMMAESDRIYTEARSAAGWGSTSDWYYNQDAFVKREYAAAATSTGVDDVLLDADRLSAMAKRERESGGVNNMQDAAFLERQSAALRDLAEAMRKLEESQKANTAATQENTKVTATGGNPPRQTSSSSLGRSDG